MVDIDKDIMESATLLGATCRTGTELVGEFAILIQAERDRCAKLVANAGVDHYHPASSAGMVARDVSRRAVHNIKDGAQ